MTRRGRSQRWLPRESNTWKALQKAAPYCTLKGLLRVPSGRVCVCHTCRCSFQISCISYKAITKCLCYLVPCMRPCMDYVDALPLTRLLVLHPNYSSPPPESLDNYAALRRYRACSCMSDVCITKQGHCQRRAIGRVFCDGAACPEHSFVPCCSDHSLGEQCLGGEATACLTIFPSPSAFPSVLLCTTYCRFSPRYQTSCRLCSENFALWLPFDCGRNLGPSVGTW